MQQWDKMKRVLMVHPGGGWGGGSIAFLKVADVLKESGVFEPVLLFSGEGMAPEIARNNGFTVYIKKVAGLGCILLSHSASISVMFRFLIEIIPSLVSLMNFIRKLGVDLVYINTSTPVAAGIAAKIQGVPLIWHVREVINTRNHVGRFVAACIKQTSDIIVANSGCSAEAISYNVQKKVYRVYDGVELVNPQTKTKIAAMKEEWGIGPETPVVGMISPLIRFKGQEIFLGAIPHIISQVPGTKFVIVGGTGTPDSYWHTFRGTLRRMFGGYDFGCYLREYVIKNGLDNIVHFLGWRKDMALVTSALDIVVFPTLIPEGFGRPQVEAGSARKPVVASDIGPARELVEDGVTGILVPPGDVEALANAVICLLKNVDLRMAMGEAGRDRVVKYFSDEIHANEMLTLFHQISNSE